METEKRLIELIGEAIYSTDWDFGDCPNPEAIADHLLANGVTFQKWIPVTERLPEDDLPKDSTSKQIKVLVAYKRGNCAWVIRTQLRQKGRWYGRPDEWDWSVSDPITHWMPLPEPPTEE